MSLILLAILLQTNISAQTLFINEFMASNSNSILDKDYNSYSDWIEIYNSTADTINMKNFFITDNLTQPKKFQFKNDFIIEPNGYKIIWCDEQNTGHHTNFKLSASGEIIAIFNVDSQLIDSCSFGEQQTDISRGRFPNGTNNWFSFATATPGAANAELDIINLIDAPIVNVESGFYSTPILISVSHNLSGVEIRYTDDGSTPEKSSELYISPIQLSETAVLRFRAFKEGFTASTTETRSYFINENSELPIFSLVTDPANLFSETNGIYVAGTNGILGHCSKEPRNWNQDWERPVSLEFFEKDRLLAFRVNTGVKIYGGCTRLYAQKSLAFYFRREYGVDKLRYNLFDDMPINEFNNFILRSSGQDWWRTMFRDGMVQTLIEQGMNIDDQNYRPAVLFINGEYWGIHNIREKLNEHYTYYHHGADKDNIDLIQISKSGSALNGDINAYNEMMNFFTNNNMADPQNYNYIKSIVDIDEYIDYQIAQIYSANGDWPGSNMKLWRERKQGGKWRWMVYDLDFTFGGNAQGMYNTNTLEQATSTDGQAWPNPAWSTLMFRKLLENVEFKNEFIQRFAAHMNTTFEASHVLAVIDSLARDIESEIPRHKQRWPQSISYASNWKALVDIMRNFATARGSSVRSHIYAKFGISTSNSLIISRNNPEWGKVYVNSVEMKKNGFRNIFFKEIPLRIKAVALPGYRFVKWEGVSNSDSPEISIVLTSNTSLSAIFELVDNSNNSIVINEINYKSSPVFDTEDWIEIFNPSNESVDLSGWKFRDNDISNQFIFGQSTSIRAHEYLVICRDTISFRKLYPYKKNIIGNFKFGLNNDKDHIYLIDATNVTIDEVAYEVDGFWNSLPNGKGPTLSLINYQLDNSKAESWTASKLHGTPGYINDVYTKVDELENGLPSEFILYQNYPNPFNPITTIQYSIPSGVETSYMTSLQVYDVLGREVALLVNQKQSAGNYEVKFDASQLVNGVYFYRLQAGSHFSVKKMIILK
jgi:hypothetical protein